MSSATLENVCTGTSRHLLRFGPFLAVLLVWVAYANSLHNPFVFDDGQQVIENQSIRSLTDWPAIVRGALTRPLVNASYAVDYARSGLDPFAYHTTNLALHSANVWLLFMLTAKLLRRTVTGGEGLAVAVPAFLASALFAVHPLMTEAVGYTSSRSELLYATFFLGSLLCFVRYVEAEAIHHVAGGAVLFVLALLSKETAVMLPPVVLLYDWVYGAGSAGDRRRRILRLHVPLHAVVLLGAVVRLWLYVSVEQPADAGFRWESLLLELYVTGRYLALIFVPAGQTLVPDVSPLAGLFDFRSLVGVSLAYGLLTFASASRDRLPIVSFGLIWYLLLLVPSAALIVIGDQGQPMAEHRAYLAAAGIFMVVAGVLAQVIIRGTRVSRLATLSAMAVVILGCTAATIQRNRTWSDPVLLWEEAVRRSPQTWASHYGAGVVYLDAGDTEAAAAAFSRAIELRPDQAPAYVGLANAHLAENRPDDSRRVLRDSLRDAPDGVWTRVALAKLEAGRFRNRAEGERLCHEALAIDPGDRQAQACLSALR